TCLAARRSVTAGSGKTGLRCSEQFPRGDRQSQARSCPDRVRYRSWSHSFPRSRLVGGDKRRASSRHICACALRLRLPPARASCLKEKSLVSRHHTLACRCSNHRDHPASSNWSVALNQPRVSPLFLNHATLIGTTPTLRVLPLGRIRCPTSEPLK